MPVESFLGSSGTRLLLLTAAFVAVASATGVSRAEELGDAERKKAVQSLRDYHAVFQDRNVEMDVLVRKDFRPAESEGPVWYEYRIVAANGWMYTEEDRGPTLRMQVAGADDKDGSNDGTAGYTVKAVFDLRSNRGLKVYVRDDGSITQAERTCEPTGILLISGRLLAQTVGWLDFWRPFLKDPDPTLDPADVLEASTVVRRVRTADGRSQLVATLVLDRGNQLEMRYSDLPDVRMTAQRLTWPGRAEITGEVRYRLDRDGFHQPHAFRDIRQRIDQRPPRVELVEEAVVTRFVMHSPAESEPIPVIEIPDDVRIRDACKGDESDDEVPVPSPDRSLETR